MSQPVPTEGLLPAVPPATVRRQVTVPLRTPDGYETEATVFTFDRLWAMLSMLLCCAFMPLAAV